MSRIFVLAINYKPELTGCGRYTGELCDDLVRAGHEVTVVTAPPHYPGWRIEPGWKNRYRRDDVDGARVYRCPLLLLSPMRGMRRAIAPLSFAISSLPVVLWRMIRRRPDAILIVQPSFLTIPAALILAKILRVRTCLHAQDLEVEAAFATGHVRASALRRLLLSLEGNCLKAFDAIVTVSRAMAGRIVEKGVDPDRVTVVRNWVAAGQEDAPTSRLRTRTRLGLRPDNFIVLYAGNMGPKQGLEIVLQAAQRLSHRSDVTFVLAGDGPRRAALEADAAGLANIRFLPVQPAETFNAFLASCDVHVLPQVAAAADLMLPSKLGGMLASGRPIVATAAAGTELASLIHGAATLVEPGDADALAGAILAERDGEDPARRERRLAIAAEWSRDKATRQIEALILNASPGSPAKGANASVSVVIPFFDAALTLDAALQSVARQTRPVTEIIVVDDGSRCDQADAARRIVEACPQARLIRFEQNAGPSAARNRGVREARGDFVAFLDADDRWRPEKIATCLDEMISKELDFLGHATACAGVPKISVSDRLRRARLYEMKAADLFISTSQFAPSTVMFRKGALPVEFDETLRRSEDYRLWGDLVFGGFRLWRLKDALTERDDAHIGGEGLSGSVAETLTAHLSTIDHFRSSGFIGRLSHVVMRGFLRARFLRHG